MKPTHVTHDGECDVQPDPKAREQYEATVLFPDRLQLVAVQEMVGTGERITGFTRRGYETILTNRMKVYIPAGVPLIETPHLTPGEWRVSAPADGPVRALYYGQRRAD